MPKITLLDVNRQNPVSHSLADTVHLIRVHGVNYHHVSTDKDGQWIYAEAPSAGVSHADVVAALRR